MNKNSLRFDQPFEPSGSITATNPVNDELVLAGDIFNPLWFVSGIGVTEEADPDGVVDVEVEITNEQVVISPTNPDVCRSGLFSGLESVVEVDPEWASAETVTVCTEVGGLSPTVDTVAFDFPAPSTGGSHSVEITVTAPGSGTGGTVVEEVFVDDEAPGRPGVPPRPGNGDNGTERPRLPDIPFLDNGTTGVVALVVVLILLIVVAVAS